MGTILKIKTQSLTPDGPTKHVLWTTSRKSADTIEIMFQMKRETVRIITDHTRSMRTGNVCSRVCHYVYRGSQLYDALGHARRIPKEGPIGKNYSKRTGQEGGPTPFGYRPCLTYRIRVGDCSWYTLNVNGRLSCFLWNHIMIYN